MSTQTLTCEHGHTWERESVRGRKPRFCPEHLPAAPAAAAKPTVTRASVLLAERGLDLLDSLSDPEARRQVAYIVERLLAIDAEVPSSEDRERDLLANEALLSSRLESLIRPRTAGW